MPSGDVVVSEKTMTKMMQISYHQNAPLLRAYPDVKVDRWNQNFVNGKYVIEYELDPSLHQTLQKLLPKVRSLLRIKQI